MNFTLRISEIYLWLFGIIVVMIMMVLSTIPLWVGLGIICRQFRLRKWVRTPAVVTQCKKIPVDESEQHEGIYTLVVQCKYVINKSEYESHVEIDTGDDANEVDKEVADYLAQKEVIVLVNPQDPNQSILLSEGDPKFIVFGSILTLLGLGLVFFVIVGYKFSIR
jgi:hypothetical protein